ncbi:1-aminocyclopropane-1-carboxylate deaminase/D-cysteine desulfhydrase [Pleomorphovibrio marinus]|uniref:1-aminocyclopropane-1-carboxylate deaminase/D-cysteine desulfhydrase n=1 Tax=Pleomorphovibrio marinus TaxID=2164132 RepID=UPI000E0C3E55|nr:pyridoxal-phosphate dependent enzyme [Pleomorphovibrio marinus]
MLVVFGNFIPKLQEIVHLTSETEKIQHPLLHEKNVALFVKRLDKLPAQISGNKYYKLKYNLQYAKSKQYTQILTFGGAYSNHINACAKAAMIHGLQSVGVIRGELMLPLNPTLSAAKGFGMKLHPLSRSDYRNKYSKEVNDQLKSLYGDFYSIPEGGTNALAIKGTQEILNAEDLGFDYICTPLGTGGTFAGIYSSAAIHQKVIGFSSLKGEFIHEEIRQILLKYKVNSDIEYELINAYHFGGYAKIKNELLEFMRAFTAATSIALDPIYTGKMMFGIFDLIKQGHFPEGSNILAIHTGGLQGNAGFEQRLNLSLKG